MWIELTTPTGSLISPLLLRTGITLPVGSPVSRTLTQSVPGSAPPGYYEYRAIAGLYSPAEIIDEDSFDFAKLLDDDNLQQIECWTLNGWDAGKAVIAKPDEPNLNSAHPNPFNPSTGIRYQLPVVSFVNLAVYDISGRKVAELANGWRDAGVQEVTFDASHLPSGVYITAITANGQQTTQKLILLK